MTPQPHIKPRTPPIAAVMDDGSRAPERLVRRAKLGRLAHVLEVPLRAPARSRRKRDIQDLHRPRNAAVEAVHLCHDHLRTARRQNSYSGRRQAFAESVSFRSFLERCLASRSCDLCEEQASFRYANRFQRFPRAPCRGVPGPQNHTRQARRQHRTWWKARAAFRHTWRKGT